MSRNLRTAKRLGGGNCAMSLTRLEDGAKFHPDREAGNCFCLEISLRSSGPAVWSRYEWRESTRIQLIVHDRTGVTLLWWIRLVQQGVPLVAIQRKVLTSDYLTLVQYLFSEAHGNRRLEKTAYWEASRSLSRTMKWAVHVVRVAERRGLTGFLWWDMRKWDHVESLDVDGVGDNIEMHFQDTGGRFNITHSVHSLANWVTLNN